MSVDYRLAPESPFPAGLDDASAALAWCQANAAALGVDTTRIGVAGDSAGANLATVVARLATRDGRPPAAQLLIYPATDPLTPHLSRTLFGTGLFLTMADHDAFVEHYTSGRKERLADPRVIPSLATDLDRLPPALVITAGFDLLRDEGEAYAAAFVAAGTAVDLRRFPSLVHGFIQMTSVSPGAWAAYMQLARDWRALLDSASR